MTNEQGEVTIGNASTKAIVKAQAAFQSAAKQMGVKDDKDVQDLVNEVRYGK